MPKNKEGTYNVLNVITDSRYEERLNKFTAQKAKFAPTEERLYGTKLNMMGRNAYFEEYFFGVKLENQVFPKVGDFDDPTKTVSFKLGYERAEVLVRTGIITEELYLQEKNSKHR